MWDFFATISYSPPTLELPNPLARSYPFVKITKLLRMINLTKYVIILLLKFSRAIIFITDYHLKFNDGKAWMHRTGYYRMVTAFLAQRIGSPDNQLRNSPRWPVFCVLPVRGIG